MEKPKLEIVSTIAPVPTKPPESLEPPYPANTRVKNWRFKLEHLRMDHTAAWAIAPLELRPWLLMMRHVAWQEVPVGSLENDAGIIAAKIGMQEEQFDANAEFLLTDWILCSDDRWYQVQIVEEIWEMLDKMASWRS